MDKYGGQVFGFMFPTPFQRLALVWGAWRRWRTETWPSIFDWSCFFWGGWWAAGVFCSHCFQGCNFVAMSLYQNKLVKSVHQDKGLSFTSSVIFPKLDRFHWGNCGALWWCWRAGIKGWQSGFSGIGERGGLLRDGLLNGVECRMLFVAIHERFSCKVSSLESCVRNSGFQQSRNMNWGWGRWGRWWEDGQGPKWCSSDFPGMVSGWSAFL